MDNATGVVDRLPLKRAAIGVRFQNQFGLEDALGAVMDDVLASERFRPERFESTVFTGDTRQIFTANGDEQLTLTRADAILDVRLRDLVLGDLPELAKDFTEVVWEAVCRRAPRPPSIIRYGCLVAVPLPDTWNPIDAVLGAEVTDNAEFDLRYTRRLPVEEALAMRDVNDYHTVIYMIQTRGGKTNGVIDFQRHFNPALNNTSARKENPFVRFVEKAVHFQRTTGWDFLKTRMQRLPRAA